MDIHALKDKTYTVAVMESFTLTDALVSQYEESMGDHPHTMESLVEFLLDLVVPIYDRSETSQMVISENKKENN
jgi:hypothetical protein